MEQCRRTLVPNVQLMVMYKIDYDKNTYNLFVIIDHYVTGTDLNTQRSGPTDIPLDDSESIYNYIQ